MTDPTSKRATMLKNLLVLIAVVSAAVSGGCTTATDKGISETRRPAPEPHADRIGLMVPQKAIVNWDGEPGFDGAIAQVMLFKNTAGGPKSVLVSGEVDIMIYEGAKPDRFSDATKPFFSWTFKADELARRVVGQYSALWGAPFCFLIQRLQSEGLPACRWYSCRVLPGQSSPHSPG